PWDRSENCWTSPRSSSTTPPPPDPFPLSGGARKRERVVVNTSACAEAQAEAGGAALRPRLPGAEVLLLLWGQGVNGDAHRQQLEPCDLMVNRGWDGIDLRLQTLGVAQHVLSAQRLIGEAHVHHAGRVSLRRREVDEAPLGQQVHMTAVLEGVLLDEI